VTGSAGKEDVQRAKYCSDFINPGQNIICPGLIQYPSKLAGFNRVHFNQCTFMVHIIHLSSWGRKLATSFVDLVL